jgi:hypothetical protein
MKAAPLPMPPLAPRPRVEITFEYAYAELHEGLTQSPDTKPKKPTPLARLLGVLFIAVATMLYMLWNTRAARRAATMPAPPLVDGELAILPSATAAAALTVLLISLVVMAFMFTSRNERVRRTARLGGGIAVLLLVGVLWLGVRLASAAPTQGQWMISRRSAMWLAFTPWMVVIVLVIASLTWLSRIDLRRQWKSKPSLRRRRTVVLDDEGEHSADETTQMLYRWPHFQRAWETARTLVLLDENQMRHVLPKRVMDQTTLDQARAIIAKHVAETHFLTTPGGFPIATPAVSLPSPTSLPVPPPR